MAGTLPARAGGAGGAGTRGAAAVPPPGSEPGPAARPGCRVRWVRRGLVLLALLILWALLWAASLHAVAGNSDGATVVLEGRALSSGNLTLAGWSLSLDSFWSIDALVYAVAVFLVGVRAALLYSVPALFAATVVVVGAQLAREKRTGLPAAAALLTVVALLALPARGLALFWLQGPLHVGTALWCLIAFAALARRRPGWQRWWLAVVLLAAGLLGDLQTLALGVAPVFLAGLVAMRRCGHRRAGSALVAAAGAAVALAEAVRHLALLHGSFAIAPANPTSGLSQLVPNVPRIVVDGGWLLGISTGPTGPPVPLPLRLVHLLGAVALLGGVGMAGVGVVRGLWPSQGRVRASSMPGPGPLRPGPAEEPWRLDDLLVIAFLGDLGVFVLLTVTSDVNFARYLTAAVIFGAILAGRLVGRWTARLGAGVPRRRAAVVGACVLLLFAASFSITLAGPGPHRPARRLAAFLITHQLHRGLGDYWSSSLVTVQSDAAVTVRPVVALPGGTLTPYRRQSSARWYAGSRFQFLVFDTAAPFGGVNAGTARVSFGTPRRSYHVGTYRVLVWSHLLGLPPG